MDTKTMAVTLTFIMLLSASLVYPSVLEADTGDRSDPKMIIGTLSNPQMMEPESEWSALISFKIEAFRNPTVRLDVWKSETSASFLGDDPSTGVKNLVNGTSAPGSAGFTGMTVTAEQVGTSGGTYLVTFEPGSTGYAGYYKLRLSVTETVNHSSVTQRYYYGANVAAGTGNIGLSSSGTTYTELNPVEIYPDVPIFSFVKEGNDYDRTGYFFYATDLPMGINMKLDGVIEGKFPMSLLGSTGEFTVYAIDKTCINSGSISQGVVSGTFDYELKADIDGFKYESSPGTYEYYNVPGFFAISNTDGFSLKVADMDPAVAGKLNDVNQYHLSYRLDDPTLTSDRCTVDGYGNIAIEEGVFDGHTGVVQLHVVKTSGTDVFELCVHIMLVGPLVHSGLTPSVSST